ncbi:MAG TPA: prolyl aminopeptidase [Gammaproteobacteria bacterium]|nr:prolyl aminopeptidase [Gammaproteobacteria bacterium]
MYSLSQPYRSLRLDVGDGHRLYLEESGAPAGLPVVFLHGGPGAGCSPFHRRFFNPEKYRVILFDQRGAGKSRPHASLQANTTAHLIADLEKIRGALDIERWVVFGGSWGSTLGLAYAQDFPERVLGLILRGVFLCRDEDIHWFYQNGASRLFPDFWRDFIEPIPENERGDLVRAYHRRLTGDDEVTRMRAAEAWALWEARTATLKVDDQAGSHFSNPYLALSLARIECHYFINHGFLEPGQLLNNARRLKDIPGVIVHGRYDSICPVDQAWMLHQAWPEATLNIIPDAGHAITEPGIAAALIAATDHMAEKLA